MIASMQLHLLAAMKTVVDFTNTATTTIPYKDRTRRNNAERRAACASQEQEIRQIAQLLRRHSSPRRLLLHAPHQHALSSMAGEEPAMEQTTVIFASARMG
jgi:hypothetical protein